MTNRLKFQPDCIFCPTGFPSGVPIACEVSTLEIRQGSVAQVIEQPPVNATGFLVGVALGWNDISVVALGPRAE